MVELKLIIKLFAVQNMNSNESVIHESIYELNGSGIKNTRGQLILESKVVPMRFSSRKANELDFSKTANPTHNKLQPGKSSFETQTAQKRQVRPQTANKVEESKTMLDENALERKSKLPPGEYNPQFIQYYEQNIKLKNKVQQMGKEMGMMKNQLHQLSQVRAIQGERQLEMLAAGKKSLWDKKQPVSKKPKQSAGKDMDSAKVSNLLEIIEHYKIKLMNADEEIQNLKRQKHLLEQDTKLKERKADQLLKDLENTSSGKQNSANLEDQLRTNTKLLQIQKQRNKYNEADIKRLETKIRTLEFNKEEMENLRQQNRTLEEQLMKLTSIPSFTTVTDRVDDERRTKQLDAKYKAINEKYTQLKNDHIKIQAEVKLLRNQLIKANAQSNQLEKQNLKLKQSFADNPILSKLSQDQKLLEEVVYQIQKKKSEVEIKSELKKQSYEKILMEKEMLANQLTNMRSKMSVMQQTWKEKERMSKIQKEQLMSTFKEQAGSLSRQQGRVMSKNGVAYTDDISMFTQDIQNIPNGSNYFDLFLGQLHLLETMISTNFNIRNTESTIILATVDFYNHNTETTRPVHGIHCNLQSEFSFKVTQDEFLFKYLNKGTFYIQIWGSEGNKRVLLGKAVVDLKPLILKSRKNMAPVVSSSIPVYMNQKVMGSINFVMRIRLPIFEQLQRVNQIDQIVSSEDAPLRKLIIQVEEGRGFPQNSNTFVYYSFRLEDYYSKTFKGSSPAWNYYKALELKYNNDLKNYLRKTQLELVILDDNAIIANEGDSDVVGTANISLVPLLQNKMVKDRVAVMKGTQRMGQIDIKIYWHESEPLDLGVSKQEGRKNLQQIIYKFLTKNKVDPDQLFYDIDKNRTGMINFQQFFTWVLKLEANITYEMANDYYAQFRQPVNLINFSSRLTAIQSSQTNEIAKQLSEINKMFSQNTEMIKKKQSLEDFLRGKNPRDICIEIDKNGNGLITPSQLQNYFDLHNIEPPAQQFSKEIQIVQLIKKYQRLK